MMPMVVLVMMLVVVLGFLILVIDSIFGINFVIGIDINNIRYWNFDIGYFFDFNDSWYFFDYDLGFRVLGFRV